MIRHEHGKWILYSQDGSKKLGEHATEGGAMEQEHAINIAKHASVRRYDVGDLAKPTRLPNGYLVADARITRVGVFDYMNPDGTRRRELRLPSEVFNADSLASFGLVPLTNEHPGEMLTAQNTRKYQVGSVGDVRADGEFVTARLMLTDDAAIAAAEGGRRQLSCGYSADVEDAPGVTLGIDGVPNGLRYDGIQRNIRGNHVALVNRGRAGSDVALRIDSTDAFMVQVDQSQEPERGRRMKTIKIDGVDFEMSEQAHQAVSKIVEKLDADTSATQAEAKRLADEVSKQTARADKSEEDLSAAKKLYADAIAPEAVAKIVRERVSLVQTAEKILGAEHGLKLDEMSDADVKKAVVLKVSPEAKAKVDACDAGYLAARFDAAVEGWKPIEPSAALALVRGASGTPGERMDSSTARKRMTEANFKIGREPLTKSV